MSYTKRNANGQATMANSEPVVIASDQSTVPVSAVSLPLPAAASTSAKQPALGTAGTASIDVITVQGIASMTALKTDGSAVTQPVSGTVTANAGTGTMAVSAASLPLPTGASIAAKQPALGTAGTPSADVLTVQGATSMTALKTDSSATTQPVSAASLPLPTGAATSAKQDTLLTELQLKADLTETQPVSLASVPSHAVTNAGTFATQPTSVVPGTGPTNLGKAEDAAHASGDTGVMALAVRNDGAATSLSGTNGDYTPIATDAAGVQYVVQKSPTATLANVASSATSVTILAANTARKGAMIYNDSTQVLYLKFGATASATSFTVPLATNTYYEVPGGYTGIIDGIWVSANGNARVTELT